MPQTPTAKPGMAAASQTSTGGTEYRYMGTHAVEVQMGDALPWLEPGEIVTLNDNDITGKIASMVNDGILVDTSTIGVQPESQAQSTDEDAAKGGK